MITGVYKTKWIRIVGKYFCCAVVVDEKGIVIETAPIVKWMNGKHFLTQCIKWNKIEIWQ